MSTTGIELKTRRRALAEAVELVSSMRFAISLLVILSIAAIIGTVLRQGDAMPNYVNQFGPFWYEIFRKLSLFTVYSSWWFLAILLVLIVSTGLCIVRNTPKMLRDMRSWRGSGARRSAPPAPSCSAARATRSCDGNCAAIPRARGRASRACRAASSAYRARCTGRSRRSAPAGTPGTTSSNRW